MKFIPQQDQMDCGPACLNMICTNYGKEYDLRFLRNETFLSREGVSLNNIDSLAQKIGFETYAGTLKLDDLILQKKAFPCILHWEQNHFVVLKDIKKKLFKNDYVYEIADPGYGIVFLERKVFEKSWVSNTDKGVCLFLTPTQEFYTSMYNSHKDFTIKSIIPLVKSFKKQLFYIFICLLIGSLLTLTLPFLTQNLIDKGVMDRNISFVVIVLMSQLCVFLSNTFVNIVRNRLILSTGTKISIAIVSTFFKRILKLPISFFDTRIMGDFNQRIQDNERVESFLTSQSLITVFSIFTFLVFIGVLWFYDFYIVFVYFILTLLSICWSIFWLRKRKILDYFRFKEKSKNQDNIYEIINGVSEIKLNNFEEYKRLEWEKVQLELFEINKRILRVDQIQEIGFEFLNQLKNIVVTFLSAILVISNSMTIGELLAISFIIGQLNAPVNQLIVFFRSFQDAKLSFRRLEEVELEECEEKIGQEELIINTKDTDGIIIENLTFQYEGPKSPVILDNLNLFIPNGKTTAVVGSSGSGKTTLLKLLLKFYPITRGNIYFNNQNIEKLKASSIRRNSGIVMQDGYIFADTIARNIATSERIINMDKLRLASSIANINDFVVNQPLGYNTKIGATGNGISGGQKQRLLIARAAYNNPQYIFFDEATSALDSENEKIIYENLQNFFINKTVFIIAHRLSTVKNADNIVVLKKGKIVEQGTHDYLVALRGEYFNLVKNQLELGQ